MILRSSKLFYHNIIGVSIKTETPSWDALVPDDKSGALTSSSVSNINISRYLKLVNGKINDFIKYFPDGVLTKEQLLVKEKEIEAERIYVEEKRQNKWKKEDKKYSESVEKGDIRQQSLSLEYAQKMRGYIKDPKNPEMLVSDEGGYPKQNGVTFDDDGKLIPLSKRFDKSIEDKRYSRSLDSLVITQEDEQFSESLRRTELDRWGKAYEKYNEKGISINEVIKKVKNLMKVQVSSGNDACYCQAKQIQPEVCSG